VQRQQNGNGVTHYRGCLDDRKNLTCSAYEKEMCMFVEMGAELIQVSILTKIN